MVACHLRVSAIGRRTLSLATTNVGQAIFGRSPCTSMLVTKRKKLRIVDLGVTAIMSVQYAFAASDMPSRRTSMVASAHGRGPFSSTVVIQASSLGPTRGVPTSVSVLTRSGRRVAARMRTGPAILAATRCAPSGAVAAISRATSSARASRLQAKSSGIGVEAPKPRRSMRTTWPRRAR